MRRFSGVRVKTMGFRLDCVLMITFSRIITVYGTICSSGQFVGPDLNYIAAYHLSTTGFPGIASQRGEHWDSQDSGAVIIYESTSTISCTGLIEEWHIAPYSEWNNSYYVGCGAGAHEYPDGCPIDFIVWKDISPTPPLSSSYYYYYYSNGGISATLVDSNSGQTAYFDNNGYQVIQIASADQIPVQSGYYIGWNSPNIQAVEFWDDYSGTDCDTAEPSTDIVCYKEFLMTKMETPLSNLDKGVHASDFFRSGEIGIGFYRRWFGIRVKLTQGTAPTFTNLPTSIVVDLLTAVGNVVFTASASDTESKQTLTFSLASSSPSGFFAIDSLGSVTVDSALDTSPGTYTLTIQVTDDIWPVTDTLTIVVMDTQTTAAPEVTTSATTVTTTASPTTQSLLSNPNTVTLIAIVTVVSAVALATSIALAVMCHQKANATSPSSSTSSSDPTNKTPSQQTQSEMSQETRPKELRPKSPQARNENTQQEQSANSNTPRQAQPLDQHPSHEALSPNDISLSHFNQQQPPLTQRYQPPTYGWL